MLSCVVSCYITFGTHCILKSNYFISMFPVVRQNGKNYEALADSLEEKTVAQCRNFFTNYKRKLNLPRIIAEYETRHVSGNGGIGGWEYDRLRMEWNRSMI